MDNKKNHNRSWIGFVVALIILLAIVLSGISGAFPNLKDELSSAFSKDLGGYQLTLSKILTAIAALAITYLVCAALSWLLRLVSRTTRIKTVTELLISVIKYLGIIIGIVWALTILGLNATAAFASLGIVTLIIGFASQRLIEDVISGLFIVLEGQYNVGDIIILDDFRGTVTRIGVRTTTIVDPGGNYNQKKQLVFICSPYRGETPDEVQQNTRNAEWYCRLAYTLGYIPFAPHLYFTRFLADNCETERKDGMAMGKVIMLQCAELWVFGDKISDGMRSEIAYAEAHSIPVKYLTNGGQTK